MTDSKQWSTLMTATLSAELDGKVPAELVADLVRAVLDESRRSAHERGVEPTMLEARQHLERFVRARSFVTRTTRPQEQAGDEPNGSPAPDCPEMAGSRS